MNNQYIYLMLEEFENSIGDYETTIVYASTNVNDFLVALTNAPRCIDVTLMIVDNGRININYDYRLCVRYSHYSYEGQCEILKGFINEVYNSKDIHIDIRDTIISYINEYINKTDFIKMDNDHIKALELERAENRLRTLYNLAEKLNYEVIKKEE